MASGWVGTVRGMPEVGAVAERRRRTRAEDIAAFTSITGDRNPLHYDEELARASVFGRLIVQGGVTSGLLNALVRPVLMLLTCPLIILTLGLGTLLLNTVMMYILRWAANLFDLGFDFTGFWAAFLGAVVVTIVSVVMTMVFKDELKKK